MVDNLKPEDRRKTMQAVKGKGTRLEKRLFSMLAGMKLKGWRRNASDVTGKPDVVFDQKRVAIFIDGCFWHGCLYCDRKLPETNRDYWERKIGRNVERAKSYYQQLVNDGWVVLRIWEHEMGIRDARKEVRARIRRAIAPRRQPPMTVKKRKTVQESRQILDKWVASCTRKRRVSKNTISVGIVVFDRLRKKCPVSRDDVISEGGEVKGSRSGLGNILEAYGLPANYLKEVATRQGHQDGQRLLDTFEWGEKLARLPDDERDNVLLELIESLLHKAREQLNREHLKLDINRRQAPTTWVRLIVETARHSSDGVVEQHLVGAKLERRFKNMAVPNYPAHAGDRQTAREGDFTVSRLVYHVTANPSRNVIQKCAENIRSSLHPILLIPSEQETRAKVLAQDEGIDMELTIISIEDFVALNIIELATDENKNFFSILKEIVQIYNRRLKEVETDFSMQIEVRQSPRAGQQVPLLIGS